MISLKVFGYLKSTWRREEIFQGALCEDVQVYPVSMDDTLMPHFK